MKKIIMLLLLLIPRNFIAAQHFKNSLAYTATRVSNHIKFLKKVHKKYSNSYPLADTSYKPQLVEPPFSHPFIIWCAKQIGANKSFEPLFELWEEFELYQGWDLLDDQLFLKDCCNLLFIIYNRMLCKIEMSGSRKTEKEQEVFNQKGLSDVRDLYAAIALLPLAKFVSLLDKIVVGLSIAISEKIEDGDGSVLGWVKQNWWIPPTVVAGIITALVIGKQGEWRKNSFLL